MLTFEKYWPFDKVAIDGLALQAGSSAKPDAGQSERFNAASRNVKIPGCFILAPVVSSRRLVPACRVYANRVHVAAESSGSLRQPTPNFPQEV
jgi:hypothetical protein